MQALINSGMAILCMRTEEDGRGAVSLFGVGWRLEWGLAGGDVWCQCEMRGEEGPVLLGWGVI